MWIIISTCIEVARNIDITNKSKLFLKITKQVLPIHLTILVIMKGAILSFC